MKHAHNGNFRIDITPPVFTMDAPPRLETRIANHSNPMNFPSISMTEIKVGDVLYWPTGQQKYSVVILADLQADGEFVFSTIYADGSSEIRKTPVETSPGMPRWPAVE